MKNQSKKARRYVSLILAIVALLGVAVLALDRPGAAPAQAENALNFNRWSSNGPEGGFVRSLAIARNNPALIYAGIDGSGVFKSTNGGETWSNTLANTDANSYVRALAIDPTTPMTVYAAREGTGAGIFKTTDGGASWRSGNNLDVATLAINPTNPNIIYAGLHGVFKTTDGGGNWSEVGIKNGMSSETTLLTLAIDPVNPNIIYAPADIRGVEVVYKSANGGESWGAFHLNSFSGFVTSLAIDPSNPNII